MQPLVIGDTVSVRDRGRWKPAKIVDVPNQSNPRSYRVKLPTVRFKIQDSRFKKRLFVMKAYNIVYKL